jgi:NAD(P)-dependent dehydrogenase (short-subunit alcohol dehydrogenase family)
MIRTDHDDPNAQEPRAGAVAIVTGGSSETGRDVARALTSWGWEIVVVYLEHPRAAEATVDEILGAGGHVVTCAPIHALSMESAYADPRLPRDLGTRGERFAQSIGVEVVAGAETAGVPLAASISLGYRAAVRVRPHRWPPPCRPMR